MPNLEHSDESKENVGQETEVNMPWFRANKTAWLNEYAKKHMSKHSRVYSSYQMNLESEVFKPAFVTKRNAATTAVKRTL